jgi:hypothetical protein
VNPDPGSAPISSNPKEIEYLDNTTATTVSVETVPPVELRMFSILYTAGEVPRLATRAQQEEAVDRLRHVLPLSNLHVRYRTLLFLSHPGVPTCTEVNTLLLGVRSVSSISGSENARDYGMIVDVEEASCAMDIPSFVASGETGWETVAHELGHCYGREHVLGKQPPGDFKCGEEPGAMLGYTGGSISPT